MCYIKSPDLKSKLRLDGSFFSFGGNKFYFMISLPLVEFDGIFLNFLNIIFGNI